LRHLRSWAKVQVLVLLPCYAMQLACQANPFVHRYF
jgi:hypothetical protein